MPFDDEVRELERAAREQLQAAWQIHVAKVEEQLRAGWQDHISQIVGQRFGDLAPILDQAIARSQRETTEQLNQTARRLRLAETPEEWRAILIESASPFCARAGLFDTADAEVASAPAIATTIESKDTTVALRTPSELGPRIIAEFAESPATKSYLFPILTAGRVSAILYADQGASGLDRNALELIATLASDTQPKPAEVPTSAAGSGLIQLHALQPAHPAAASQHQEPLSEEEQELHVRAQRFARVRIAEMRLYDSAAVRHGREIRDIYGVLRSKIDSARLEFQKEYLHNSASMADYLHQELVRTLANNDEEALGTDYPGALR
ncbi:MAG: hypothetical protein JNL98_28280 [Bryobacterales bacterium]|nr:hypothetical protein [Bryobacterales bacterium]